MLIKNSIVSIFCLLVVITLHGCGGGGGGGGGGSGNASSSSNSKTDFKVTFVPSSLSADLVETAGTYWTVQVTVAGQVEGDVYTAIEDKKGVITTNVYLEQLSSSLYKATFRVSKKLAAGTYTDSIKLRLCKDRSCVKEYSGSPWSLPYTVKVLSHSNPVALSPIPDYQGWVSRFGGKTNTGFVPITLDPAKFTYRWFKRLPKNIGVNELVVEKDKIFYYQLDTWELNYAAFSVVALDQKDGSTLWTKTFEPAVGSSAIHRGFGLNVADGLVSLMRFAPPNGDAHFTALDPGSGQITLNQKTWDQAYSGSGALLDGDYFYMYGSFQNYYGLGRVSRNDGTLNWLLEGPDYDNNINREKWLPTMDEQHIYVYGRTPCSPTENCDPAGLKIVDKSTSSKVVIADPNAPIISGGEIMPPIITEQGILALSGRKVSIYDYTEPSLGLYDTTNNSVKWSLTGAFAYQPVVANGIVYTVIALPSPAMELKVVARNLTTGEELWSLPIVNPEGYFSDIVDSMLVTNNILFVATAHQVLAVDINTHQIVWKIPFGGNLAMTQSGVLVISRKPDKNYDIEEVEIISAVTLK